MEFHRQDTNVLNVVCTNRLSFVALVLFCFFLISREAGDSTSFVRDPVGPVDSELLSSFNSQWIDQFTVASGQPPALNQPTVASGPTANAEIVQQQAQRPFRIVSDIDNTLSDSNPRFKRYTEPKWPGSNVVTSRFTIQDFINDPILPDAAAAVPIILGQHDVPLSFLTARKQFDPRGSGSTAWLKKYGLLRKSDPESALVLVNNAADKEAHLRKQCTADRPCLFVDDFEHSFHLRLPIRDLKVSSTLGGIPHVWVEAYHPIRNPWSRILRRYGLAVAPVGAILMPADAVRGNCSQVDGVEVEQCVNSLRWVVSQLEDLLTLRVTQIGTPFTIAFADLVEEFLSVARSEGELCVKRRFDQDLFLKLKGADKAGGEAISMLSKPQLDNIVDVLELAAHHGVMGDYAEFGVYKGGSCVVARNAIDQCPTRHVLAADSFLGFPDPVIGQDSIFKDIDVSVGGVANAEANMRRFGVVDRVDWLVGFYNESMSVLPRDHLNIAVLRVDCDMYEAILQVLCNMYDHVPHGGFVIIDDWGPFPQARRAVQRFIDETGVGRSAARLACVDPAICNDPWYEFAKYSAENDFIPPTNPGNVGSVYWQKVQQWPGLVAATDFCRPFVIPAGSVSVNKATTYLQRT